MPTVCRLLGFEQHDADQNYSQVHESQNGSELSYHQTGNHADQQSINCNYCQKQHDCEVCFNKSFKLVYCRIKLLLNKAGSFGGVDLVGDVVVLVFHNVNSFPSSKIFFTSEFFPDVFFVQPVKQNMLNMHILLNYMKLLIQKQHKTITVYRYNNIQNSPQFAGCFYSGITKY